MEIKVKSIMADVLKVKAEEIGEESSMKTLARWDSLKHMQLMVAIEENFDIPQLTMDQIIKMTSYSSIISTLREIIGNKE